MRDRVWMEHVLLLLMAEIGHLLWLLWLLLMHQLLLLIDRFSHCECVWLKLGFTQKQGGRQGQKAKKKQKQK